MFQRCLSLGKLEHFGRHSSSFFGKKIFTWLLLLFPWSSIKKKTINSEEIIEKISFSSTMARSEMAVQPGHCETKDITLFISSPHLHTHQRDSSTIWSRGSRIRSIYCPMTSEPSGNIPAAALDQNTTFKGSFTRFPGHTSTLQNDLTSQTQKSSINQLKKF